ncbi:hypothetical protein TNCV_122241 [Trichonephila clavipes]|nr:hypothetical protein TNCV_122241 [Trichonephila clavipes]
MEPTCDRRLQLFVFAKTLIGGQKFLEVQESVKITGSKIRAAGADQTAPRLIPSKQLLCVEPYVNEYCRGGA